MDVLRYLSGFFSFRGRIGRLDFLIFFAVCAAAIMSVVILARASPGNAFVYIFIFVILFAMSIAFFATGVRRLHDRAWTGWMIIVFYAIPLFINTEILEDKVRVSFRIDIGNFEEGWFLRTVASAILIWAIVELFILRGTIGPNKYGPDPLEPAAAPSDKPQNPAGG